MCKQYNMTACIPFLKGKKIGDFKYEQGLTCRICQETLQIRNQIEAEVLIESMDAEDVTCSFN